MTDVTQIVDGADAQTPATTEPNPIDALKAELANTQELLAKARRGETDNRNARKALETRVAELEGDEFKSKYEATVQELTALRDTVNQRAIDSAISTQATAAGAKDLKAVLRLVERSGIEVKDGIADAAAVEAAITKARTEYEVLFEAPKTPAVKRPGEGNVTDTFKNEMSSAKSKQELLEVMKRYGIGSTI